MKSPQYFTNYFLYNIKADYQNVDRCIMFCYYGKAIPLVEVCINLLSSSFLDMECIQTYYVNTRRQTRTPYTCISCHINTVLNLVWSNNTYGYLTLYPSYYITVLSPIMYLFYAPAYICTMGSYASLSVHPSICLSVTEPKFRLEHNSYLRKFSKSPRRGLITVCDTVGFKVSSLNYKCNA